MTDFHLDQHYGTAGPLGEFDYVGYYDYATCWNISNTAKLAYHDFLVFLEQDLPQVWGAHLRLALGLGHLCRGLHGLVQAAWSWQGWQDLVHVLLQPNFSRSCSKLFKRLCSQVRFVLWTGDDTVHCDDAYSSKDTVGGFSFR